MKFFSWLCLLGAVVVFFWGMSLLSRPPSSKALKSTPDGRSGSMAAIAVVSQGYGINRPASDYGNQQEWPAIKNIWKHVVNTPRVVFFELTDVVRDRCGIVDDEKS